MLRNYEVIGAALIALAILGAGSATAQDPTPDACATDVASRWATVMAYETPTTSYATLRCDVDVVLVTDTVDVLFYYDVRFASARGGLFIPVTAWIDGVPVWQEEFFTGEGGGDTTHAGTRAVTVTGAPGVRRLWLEVGNSALADAAECETWFGDVLTPTPDLDDFYEQSDGRTWRYVRQVTAGEDALGHNAWMNTFAVLMFLLVVGALAWWRRDRK